VPEGHTATTGDELLRPALTDEALGRLDEARAEFERAASLTRNARQRARLEARAAACHPG
jgi:predicted RNA polymerase sigma factor